MKSKWAGLIAAGLLAAAPLVLAQEGTPTVEPPVIPTGTVIIDEGGLTLEPTAPPATEVTVEATVQATEAATSVPATAVPVATLAPSATLVPEATAEMTDTFTEAQLITEDRAMVTFGGVSFQYDPLLLGAVRPIRVTGVPYTGDAPPGSFYPDYLAFSFYDLGVGEVVPYNVPTLQIYRGSDIAAYEDPAYADALTNLSTLTFNPIDLGEFINASAGTDPSLQLLPYLPPIAASQVLRAQPIYLSGDEVSGIRYLTYFAQDASPLIEGSILYTFQGVTGDLAADGSGEGYYIAFTTPINTGLLPGEIAADFDYDAFVGAYDDYLSETVGALNQAGGATFAPSLDALDEFILSLVIE